MATRWWPAIAIVLALQHAPGLVQPVAILELMTTSVYVRNNSTATIDAGVGTYNVSVDSAALDSALAAHAPIGALQASVEDQLGLLGAFSGLTLLRGFASHHGGQGSTRAADGSVTAPIVRANLVISTTINNVDASNAFRETGLVATFTFKCAETLVASLSQLQTSYSQSFNVTSIQSLSSALGTGNVTSVVVNDVSFAVDSPTSVIFNATYFVGNCLNCMALPPNQSLNGSLATCRNGSLAT